MKKTVLPILLLLVSGSIISMQTLNNSKLEKFKMKHVSGTGHDAKTGAPGEANCTACHTGTALSGTGINTITVLDGTTAKTSYVPGATYNVALQISVAATKRGFQIVGLKSDNTQAGVAVGSAVGGTAITTGTGPQAGRKYVNHTAISSLSTLGWAFTWTAPAAGSGTVTFYVASNVTNNDGGNTGDVIYTSTHTITESAAGLTESVNTNENFFVGYSATSNAAVISFDAKQIANTTFKLTDLSGKTLVSSKLGENSLGANKMNVTLPEHLNTGMYIATLTVGSQEMTTRLFISK
jgi:hypothetical protein